MKFDETQRALVGVTSFNNPPELTEQIFIRPGEGTAGLAFEERRPVWSSDYTTDERNNVTDPKTRRAVDAMGIRGVLAVPVVVRNEAYGVQTFFIRTLTISPKVRFGYFQP